MTDHSIKGKIVIIAGGAKNLGGLIARDLAAHGAKAVAIHYNSDSTKAEADATIAAIKAAGAQAVAFQADLTVPGPWKSCSPMWLTPSAVPTLPLTRWARYSRNQSLTLAKLSTTR